MTRIEIQGVSYPAPEKLTNREVALVQRITGVLPTRWLDSVDGGDINLQVALAMVILTRAGQTPDVEKLYDLEPGFLVGIEDEEDAAGPPAVGGEVEAPSTAPTPLLTRSDTRAASGAQR